MQPGKQVHEIRGFSIDNSLSLHASSPLERSITKIGEDVLAKFVHIFEQTILTKDWLGREQFAF